MTMPIPERPPASKPRRPSWLSLVFALLCLIVLAGLLLVLPTGFIGPTLVFGGLFFLGFIGLHYLVWGRMLSRILQDEEHSQDSP